MRTLSAAIAGLALSLVAIPHTTKPIEQQTWRAVQVVDGEAYVIDYRISFRDCMAYVEAGEARACELEDK